MRAVVCGFLVLGLSSTGCRTSTSPGDSVTFKTDPSLALAEAVDLLSAYSAFDKQKVDKGVEVTTYKLTGVSLGEAKARIEPLLKANGFTEKSSFGLDAFYVRAPHGTWDRACGMILLDDSVPGTLPFTMTTFVSQNAK